MSVVATVTNGTITSDNSSTTTSVSTTSEDQEMFLQLLVAEMQYQDPLEPTSNSEYVSELASFSQIEAIQTVQDQVNTLQANSLVGQYVELLTTDSSGNQEYVSGKVDYVSITSDGTTLTIGGEEYDMDDLQSVVNEEYYVAITAANSLISTISNLPSTYNLTLSDESKLTAVRETYDAMTDYQKSMISSSYTDILENLEARMAELKGTTDEDE